MSATPKSSMPKPAASNGSIMELESELVKIKAHYCG